MTAITDLRNFLYMSDSEGLFFAGEISWASIPRPSRPSPKSSNLRRHLATIKPDLDQIEERLRFQVQEFDPGISG